MPKYVDMIFPLIFALSFYSFWQNLSRVENWRRFPFIFNAEEESRASSSAATQAEQKIIARKGDKIIRCFSFNLSSFWTFGAMKTFLLFPTP